jgi:hypothetical protein
MSMRNLPKRLFRALFAMVIGTLAVYTFGILTYRSDMAESQVRMLQYSAILAGALFALISFVLVSITKRRTTEK